MNTKTNKAVSSLKKEAIKQSIPYIGVVDGVNIKMNVEQVEGQDPENVTLTATKANEEGKLIFGINGSYQKNGKSLAISCYGIENLVEAPVDTMAKMLQEMIAVVLAE